MPDIPVVLTCSLFSLFFQATWNFFHIPKGLKGEVRESGGFLVFASSSSLIDQGTENHPPSRDAAFHRVALRPVKSHRANFVTLREKLSSPTGGAPEASTPEVIQCSLQFEGPIEQPPTLTLGPTSGLAGPFLSVLRDTHPDAHGWIHGYQKGLHPDASVKFGAAPAGDGEYVEVHPPSGEHQYDLLLFDQDYELGPKLSALVGTPWHNKARALGGEAAVVEDVRAGNDKSEPQIIGRCSVTVSHEQVITHEDM